MRKDTTALHETEAPKSTVTPEVLNEIDSATYIAHSRGYLRKARMGTFPGSVPGPKFLKIGRSIRYRIRDLDAWLDAHEVG